MCSFVNYHPLPSLCKSILIRAHYTIPFVTDFSCDMRKDLGGILK